jgi:hypothetical protein
METSEEAFTGIGRNCDARVSIVATICISNVCGDRDHGVRLGRRLGAGEKD